MKQTKMNPQKCKFEEFCAEPITMKPQQRMKTSTTHQITIKSPFDSMSFLVICNRSMTKCFSMKILNDFALLTFLASHDMSETTSLKTNSNPTVGVCNNTSQVPSISESLWLSIVVGINSFRPNFNDLLSL
jgi:hypothetical protein